MSLIRLGDADREKLGCAEWLDLDLTNLSTDEGEQIELAGGDFGDFFRSGVVGLKTRVWVALHRAGCAPPKLADLSFNLAAVDIESGPGKAPSARSAKSTRTRSGGTRGGGSTRSNKAS